MEQTLLRQLEIAHRRDLMRQRQELLALPDDFFTTPSSLPPPPPQSPPPPESLTPPSLLEQAGEAVIGPFRELGRGLLFAGGELNKAFATALEAAGIVTGIDVLRQKGRLAREFFHDINRQFDLPQELQGSIIEKPSLLLNPRWWSWSIGSTLPSLGAQIVPAIGTQSVLKLGGAIQRYLPWTEKVIGQLAKVGALVTGGAIGGYLEGASTFEEVKARGGTDSEALKAMALMGLVSAGLNSLSNLSILTKAKTRLGKSLRSGIVEAVTEWLEGPGEALILGDDIIEAMKREANVLGPAFVLGAGAGALEGGTRRGAQPQEAPQAPPTPETEAGPPPPPPREAARRGEEALRQILQGERLEEERVPPRPSPPAVELEEERVAPPPPPPAEEGEKRLAPQAIPEELPRGFRVREDVTGWVQEGEGQRTPGFAYLDLPPGARLLYDEIATVYREQREQQKRGIQTWTATKAAAARLIEDGKMTMQRILDAEPGTIWNAEEVEAARQLTATAFRVLDRLATRLMQGEALPSPLFKTAWALTALLHLKTSAVTSEIGRALNILRSQVSGLESLEPGVEEGVRRASEEETEVAPPPPPPEGETPTKPVSYVLTSDIGAIDLKDLTELALTQDMQAIDDRTLADMYRLLPTHKQQKFLSLWARLRGAVLEAFYGSILSRPITHVRNVLGGTAVLPLSIAERKVAEFPTTQAIARGLSSLYQRIFAPDRVAEAEHIASGEAGAMAAGLVHGLRDAFRLISEVQALYKKAGQAGLTGLERALATEAGVQELLRRKGPLTVDIQEPSITSAKFPEVPGSLRPLVDSLGLIFRFPTTGLQTEDVLLKMVNYQIEKYALAHRKAVMQGLVPGTEAYGEAMARLVELPTPEMHERARQFADEQTFTKEFTGRMKFLQLAASHPLVKLFLLPFFRTPVRLIEYAMVRTPGLNLLAIQFHKDILAGGARADLAIAKLMVGGALITVFGSLAAMGLIRGDDPEDETLRRLKEQAGFRRRTFWTPDGWVSYDGMEPLTTIIASAATAVEIMRQLPEEAEQIFMALTLAAADTMMVRRYLQGASDFINIVGGGKDASVRVEELARRLMPPLPFEGLLREVTRQTDPVIRSRRSLKELRDLIDEYKSRIPGLSATLPPERNMITGEPLLYGGAWGPDWISPFYISKPVQDPVLDEIIRLKGAHLRPVPWVIAGAGAPPLVRLEPPSPREGVLLSRRQRDRWIVLMTQEVRIGGKTLHQRLQSLMQSPHYQRQSDGPDGGKALMIYQTVREYRDLAKERLLREDDDLRRRVEQVMRQRIERLLPPSVATPRATVGPGLRIGR